MVKLIMKSKTKMTKAKEIKVSVVINTLNEEKNIEGAIISVADFADEIVIVDMKSDDATRTIARKLGAKVYEYKRMGYVEPARNFAIDKATGEWIFVLDSDERLTQKLIEKLESIIKNPKAEYFGIPRKNMIFGKWIEHSKWWPDYNIRFFKKGFVEWSEIIHSVPTTSGRGLDLEPKEEYAIVHNHYESIDQYIERLNRYTSMQAKNLFENGKKFVWRDLITKPSNEFIGRYFQAEGYKDGVHGLVLATLQGFSEAVLYMKLWQLNKFNDQDISLGEVIKLRKKVAKDSNYWHASVLIDNGAGILQKLRRKFMI